MSTPRIGDRQLFPTLEARAYLNHAAVSPLSTPVQHAAHEAMADIARLGVAAVGPWMEKREALRTQVAAWIASEPDGIGFPPGTTRGIVDIALAIPWKSGDRIIVFDGEFPSNVRPWLTVAERFGAEVVSLPVDGFADGSGTGLARVEAALKQGRVRLVAVSAVQFQTGLRMPLGALSALAHAHDAELFVDAIQALGVVPLDVTALGVDYLVAGTHKWLMGVDGLAIVHAAPAARARLTPLTAGWLSCEEPLRFLFEGEGLLPYSNPLRTRMDWLEGGVQTTAAFAGLAASVEILATLGVARIYAHVQAWHDAIEPELLARGFLSARAADPAARSGTLSVRPPFPLAVPALAAALGAAGVAVSTPDGWLRFSPHWPNAMDEVPVVLDALDEALRA